MDDAGRCAPSRGGELARGGRHQRARHPRGGAEARGLCTFDEEAPAPRVQREAAPVARRLRQEAGGPPARAWRPAAGGRGVHAPPRPKGDGAPPGAGGGLARGGGGAAARERSAADLHPHRAGEPHRRLPLPRRRGAVRGDGARPLRRGARLPRGDGQGASAPRGEGEAGGRSPGAPLLRARPRPRPGAAGEDHAAAPGDLPRRRGDGAAADQQGRRTAGDAGPQPGRIRGGAPRGRVHARRRPGHRLPARAAALGGGPGRDDLGAAVRGGAVAHAGREPGPRGGERAGLVLGVRHRRCAGAVRGAAQGEGRGGPPRADRRGAALASPRAHPRALPAGLRGHPAQGAQPPVRLLLHRHLGHARAGAEPEVLGRALPPHGALRGRHRHPGRGEEPHLHRGGAGQDAGLFGEAAPPGGRADGALHASPPRREGGRRRLLPRGAGPPLGAGREGGPRRPLVEGRDAPAGGGAHLRLRAPAVLGGAARGRHRPERGAAAAPRRAGGLRLRAHLEADRRGRRGDRREAPLAGVPRRHRRGRGAGGAAARAGPCDHPRPAGRYLRAGGRRRVPPRAGARPRGLRRAGARSGEGRPGAHPHPPRVAAHRGRVLPARLLLLPPQPGARLLLALLPRPGARGRERAPPAGRVRARQRDAAAARRAFALPREGDGAGPGEGHPARTSRRHLHRDRRAAPRPFREALRRQPAAGDHRSVRRPQEGHRPVREPGGRAGGGAAVAFAQRGGGVPFGQAVRGALRQAEALGCGGRIRRSGQAAAAGRLPAHRRSGRDWPRDRRAARAAGEGAAGAGGQARVAAARGVGGLPGLAAGG